jgi:formyl-CoA transferase
MKFLRTRKFSISAWLPPVQHGSLGKIEVVNQAVKLSRTPSQIAHPTPEKGEHTEEVLREYGYDDKSIAEFRARKIV